MSHSLGNRAYVLGVTISSDGPKPAAPELPSATNVVPVKFRFHDDSGEPRANVLLECKYVCEGYSVKLGPKVTDQNGEVSNLPGLKSSTVAAL